MLGWLEGADGRQRGLRYAMRPELSVEHTTWCRTFRAAVTRSRSLVRGWAHRIQQRGL
jgi:hypothetical protein